MHMVPPQSAPDWVKKSPLADPAGYIEIDKHTMRHTRYPDVFALGDAGSSPNSKTGAAIRKQAPVVVANLVDVMAGRAPSARYEGYASCPLTTSRHASVRSRGPDGHRDPVDDASAGSVDGPGVADVGRCVGGDRYVPVLAARV